MITRLKLPLEQAEYTALLKVAGDELRNPVDQARFILRRELERRGLLFIQTPAGSCHYANPSLNDPKQEGSHVTA
jgi:hypothetical protein